MILPFLTFPLFLMTCLPSASVMPAPLLLTMSPYLLFDILEFPPESPFDYLAFPGAPPYRLLGSLLSCFSARADPTLLT